MLNRSPVSMLVSNFLAGSILVAAFGAAPARATPIAYGTAFASPSYTVDFSGLSTDTPIDVTYLAGDGVTFSGLYATDFYGNTFRGTTAPAAVNYVTGGAASPSAISISFAAPVTAAQFYLETDGYGTTITSLLGGNVVETTTALSYASNGNDYFGFTDSLFDEITLTVSQTGTALIDNLQVVNATALTADVPEPGSGSVLLAGLAGLIVLGGPPPQGLSGRGLGLPGALARSSTTAWVGRDKPGHDRHRRDFPGPGGNRSGYRSLIDLMTLWQSP